MKNKKHLLQHSSCTEAEEVQVDGQATVKPIFLKTEGGTSQVEFEKITFTFVKNHFHFRSW